MSKHYLIEFDIVRQIAHAKMVVQADTIKQAEYKAQLEVYRQYNDNYTNGFRADISETTLVSSDEVAEYDLNTIIDLEEF